jgi:hypothetical protein
MNILVRLIQSRLSWGVLLAATLVLFPFDWLSESWPAFGSLFDRVFVSAREHALGHSAVFLIAGLLVLYSLPRLRRTLALYLLTLSAAALGEEFFQGLSRWRLPEAGDGRDLAFDALGFVLAYLLAWICSIRREMRPDEKDLVIFPAGEWLQTFQENARLRLAIPWERGITVEPPLRWPLIRSLQRFQVGEQGDGLHLSRAAARTRHTEYRATIDLFIKEEQEHSRLLARSIAGMGGTLLRHHWSDTCFVFLRRLLGLRMELLVLLVAEVIAQVYYKALHDGTADVVLKQVFAQILHDEHNHVAFHCAYLRQAFASLAPPASWLLARSWGLLFRLVCLLVITDHRSVFRALGMKPQTCWRECMLAFEATGIFTRS